MQRNLTKGPITVNLLLFALPLMFGNLLQQLYNVADTWVVGRYLGANAFAAAVKIDSFAYMPVQDFGNAFSTYVAKTTGQRKKNELKGIWMSVPIGWFLADIIGIFYYFKSK